MGIKVSTFGVKSMTSSRWLILGSPLAIVLFNHVVARLFLALLGEWAWVGTMLVYWGTLLATIALSGGMSHLWQWLDQPRGSWLWWVFGIAMGAIGFPLLLIPNLAVMNSAALIVLWLLVAVVNAPCEELYWRGFLLDGTATFPRWFGVAYSSVLMAANHPAMLGVFSKANTFHWSNPVAFIPFGIIALALALSFAAMYLGTRSLRLPIFSHFLADLGSMSVFVFMNLVPLP